MARTRGRPATSWKRAQALLADFDRATQEQKLRDVDAGLSAASGALDDVHQQLQSAAGALDGRQTELLDVADACKAAAARLSPVEKIIGAVVAAMRLTRDRRPETPWERTQRCLRGFNRQDQEARLRELNADLAAASHGRTRALEQVNAAASALREVDLLDVADAGKAAAARATEFQAVTKLIGDITTANYHHGLGSDEPYREFERLLKADYQQLALEDDYPAEAEAFAALDAVLDRMGEIRLAPRIASRNLCAVAGGFSSGKSSFLNALIGGAEDLLPTRITPTTSIPTFIFNVKDAGLNINVFNPHGGSIEIEPKALQQMTHDFKREHGIELKRLVERVSIYTPELQAWGNVALIDTPGYTNPDDADGDTSDEEVALRSIWQSRFLIWLVDCEKGTLPEQDVGLIKRFLQQRAESRGDDAIYLVLNKADKKPEEQRKNILKQVVETCTRHEIPYFGIALYSAHTHEWYGYEGRPFDEFLAAVNSAEADALEKLEDDVEAVFARYAEYHAEEQKRLTAALGLMNRLSLGLEDDQPKLKKSLNTHQRALKKAIKNHKEWTQRAVVLRGQFLHAVRGFITAIEAIRDVR